MKIAVFGAGGALGRRVVAEALRRGHAVTAVVRDPARFDLTGERLGVSRGDVTDAGSVAQVGAGHDAAISAVGPSREGGDPAMLVAAARALLTGLARAGVPRLVVAGGAGSLEVAPGVRLVDTPEFRPAWRPLALAHADALEALRSADTDVAWSYASPAALLVPGERTGRYRVGGDQLLTDAAGNSSLSMEDFAIALVDEAEQPRHVRARFSVAN